MKEEYRGNRASPSSFAHQCRALHAQTGRLSLLVALAEEGKEDLSQFRCEFEKVRANMSKLEELLLLEEQQRSCSSQPSLIP